MNRSPRCRRFNHLYSVAASVKSTAAMRRAVRKRGEVLGAEQQGSKRQVRSLDRPSETKEKTTTTSLEALPLCALVHLLNLLPMHSRLSFSLACRAVRRAELVARAQTNKLDWSMLVQLFPELSTDDFYSMSVHMMVPRMRSALRLLMPFGALCLLDLRGPEPRVFSTEGLERSFGQWPPLSLVELDVRQCVIEDEHLEWLCNACPQLHRLKLTESLMAVASEDAETSDQILQTTLCQFRKHRSQGHLEGNRVRLLVRLMKRLPKLEYVALATD